MMHIIHNVTSNLGDVLECYSPLLRTMKAVSALIAGKGKQAAID